MEETNNKLFAKIPTILFYETIGDEAIEKNKCIKDNSILTNIRDSKVILILYQLYIRTNFLYQADVSIGSLISKSNYYSNSKIKNEFKNILKELLKLKYINMEYDIDKITHNELFTINTIKLIDMDKFIKLEQKELDILINSSTNKKELLNLLKVYLYLKSRCYKKKNDGKTYIEGGKSQTTYCSYENIAEYTYTSQGHIIEYIVKLQELKMIRYKNLGRKYLEKDKNKKITYCCNLYTITSIIQGDYIESELKEGLKQQQEDYEKQGYIIVKDIEINNRVIYGRKGFLTKKLNNNTITDKETKELNLLNTDIEEYKLIYSNKLNKKKIK